MDDVFILGQQMHTVDELSKWHKDAYVNRVTIKSNVAYALLQLANIASSDTILDPFCGGGTILLEAASTFPSTSTTKVHTIRII